MKPVADLLECLIQIKALRDTAARVVATLPGTAPADARGRLVNARIETLAASEEAFSRILRASLPHGPSLARSAAPPDAAAPADPPAPVGSNSPAPDPEAPWAAPLRRFVATRRATLALLDRCSAADLSAPTPFPGRGMTTVADLVALMLAADTLAVGDLRAAAETGAGRPRSHP